MCDDVGIHSSYQIDMKDSNRTTFAQSLDFASMLKRLHTFAAEVFRYSTSMTIEAHSSGEGLGTLRAAQALFRYVVASSRSNQALVQCLTCNERTMQRYEYHMSRGLQAYATSVSQPKEVELESGLIAKQNGGSSHGAVKAFHRLHASRLKCLISGVLQRWKWVILNIINRSLHFLVS